MGFAPSKKSIERVRPILELVRDSKGGIVRVPSKTPTKLAYVVFEAFKASLKLPADDVDRKFATLKEKYIVRAKQDHIAFEPRNALDFGNPVVELAQARVIEPEMVLEGLTTAFEIVGAAIKHRSARMIFPNGDMLEETDVQKISRWADKNDYILTQNPMTLTKNEPSNSIEEASISQQG